MRLIDADKFILTLMDASLSSVDEDTILDLVDSIPTVDAVPVVRCKDCKDWGPGLGGIPICRKTNKPMSPNGFCSIGDRKEAGNA